VTALAKRDDKIGGYDIYSIDSCLVLLFSSTMKIYKVLNLDRVLDVGLVDINPC